MGILNLSPDSFSETNESSKTKASNPIMNLIQKNQMNLLNHNIF